MKTILIIEDDKSLSSGITLTLKSGDRQFFECPNLKDARNFLKTKTPELIILDVNLPDGDGFEFCREIKETMEVPILFLTAKDTELDEVYGFEVGGSDYITKPFSLAVLRARTEALLRNNPVKSKEVNSVFKTGCFSFDFENMNFQKDGRDVELSKTEQKLLYILTSNKNNVIPREKIMDYVWRGNDEFVYENSLSVVVRRLREKLEDDPSNPKHIKTVFGVGYTWAEEQ